METGMAQGAVDSLLGRLTGLLVDEAQLLGGVRGDVQFIRDEMDSMNSLLVHLTDAQHRAPHVRTWMKQVVGLARDCEGQVELYVQSIAGASGRQKGLMGCLRRLVWLLRTVPARHRVATRIRELKVRARDVADRRQRYGVTVPSDQAAAAAAAAADDPIIDVRGSVEEEEDVVVARRRHALLDGEPPEDDEDVVERGIARVVEWLMLGGGPQLTTLCIQFPDLGHTDEKLADRIVEGAYMHPSVVSSFGCKARIRRVRWKTVAEVLWEMLRESAPAAEIVSYEDVPEDEKIMLLGQQLQRHFKAAGKRFFIVLDDVHSVSDWERIRSALQSHADSDDDGCPASGSVIIPGPDRYVGSIAGQPSTTIFHLKSLFAFFCYRAKALIAGSKYCSNKHVEIVLECCPDAFAMKMLLHLLYVNPNRTENELSNYRATLQECKRLNRSAARQMLTHCYNELPSMYRSCLLYLSVFPKDHTIRRASLARRWIAEGLIPTSTDHIETSGDELAERYFDALLTRGFLCPKEVGVEGNIKSCTVHRHVREFVTRKARDVNFVDTDMPTVLAHHLSIHNTIGLQASYPDFPLELSASAIVDFLPTLAKSSQWPLLKLLDLEGCKGLKKNHLKSICNIVLLRYLSLRNTDVVQLPDQIENLRCLETLDVRQTKIQEHARKAIVLPMLKRFLSGGKVSTNNDATRSEESFFSVKMASLCTRRMKNLEILSHVRVSNSEKELAGIAQLLKLRKFGVVLHGKNAKLKDLFNQTEKLHRCLRSLSIRIDQPAVGENQDAGTIDTLPSPPKFLQSINISGVTSRLCHLIQELHQLAKLTLSETYLKGDDLHILGKLGHLRCLRLLRKSYAESDLAFSEEEFQSLRFLAVEGSDITNIRFSTGAVPKLERIVLSFPTMASIYGVNNLSQLMEFVLNGDCNPEVRRAIEWNLPPNVVFRHKPCARCEEA